MARTRSRDPIMRILLAALCFAISSPRLARSMGDIHAAGNPHIHLDPGNIARVSAALSERMANLDRADTGYYEDREKSFLQRWSDATARWEKQGAPLKGMPLVVYHKN